MANINWQSMSARHICNLYRALFSFKWLITHWHNRRVKIKEIDILNNSIDETNSIKLPGYVEFDKNHQCLKVYCVDGQFIRIKKLVLEGKKLMNAADFNNGFLKKIDQTQRFFT